MPRHVSPHERGGIDGIGVRVDRDGLVPLLYDFATTGLEAKFCLRYVLAAAALDGEITVATFADARVTSGRYDTLMERVEVVVDEAVTWSFAEVTMSLSNGEVGVGPQQCGQGVPRKAPQ